MRRMDAPQTRDENMEVYGARSKTFGLYANHEWCSIHYQTMLNCVFGTRLTIEALGAWRTMCRSLEIIWRWPLINPKPPSRRQVIATTNLRGIMIEEDWLRTKVSTCFLTGKKVPKDLGSTLRGRIHFYQHDLKEKINYNPVLNFYRERHGTERKKAIRSLHLVTVAQPPDTAARVCRRGRHPVQEGRWTLRTLQLPTRIMKNDDRSHMLTIQTNRT